MNSEGVFAISNTEKRDQGISPTYRKRGSKNTLSFSGSFGVPNSNYNKEIKYNDFISSDNN